MKNKCDTCKESYILHPTNAVVFLPTDRTYMDHVLMCCKKGHQELLFFCDDDARDHFLETHEQLTIIRDVADPDAVELYQELFEIELMEYIDITPRQEDEVHKLATLLDTTPMEWLMEVFTSPPPKSTLPHRWH